MKDILSLLNNFLMKDSICELCDPFIFYFLIHYLFLSYMYEQIYIIEN